MKRLAIIILFLNIILGFSCNRPMGEEFHGSYSGYYVVCERIELDFQSSNRVEATISSADFVGRFSDKLYGKYEKRGDSIFIKWTSFDMDNEKTCYRYVPTDIDTVFLTDSPDTIRFVSQGDVHILTDESIIKQLPGFSHELLIFAICILPIYFAARFFYKHLNKED